MSAPVSPFARLTGWANGHAEGPLQMRLDDLRLALVILDNVIVLNTLAKQEVLSDWQETLAEFLSETLDNDLRQLQGAL